MARKKPRPPGRPATTRLGPHSRMGSKIRGYRRAEGLSQEELAKKSDIRQTTLSRIERGQIEPPLHRLRLLAAALEIPVSAIV